MASRSDSDTRDTARSPANSVLNPLNKLIGGFTNMFTRKSESEKGAGESETLSQGHQPSSSSSSPAINPRAERLSAASSSQEGIVGISKRQQKKRNTKKGARRNPTSDDDVNIVGVSAGPQEKQPRFSAAEALPPATATASSSAGFDAGDALSVLSTLGQQPTPTETSFASPLSEEGDTALAEDTTHQNSVIPKSSASAVSPSPPPEEERLPSSIASPATGVATLYVVGHPREQQGFGTYSPTSLQDVTYAREFVPRGAAAALTEENIHDLQQTQGHQHLYAETMYARGEEEVLNGYEDSYTAEDVVFSPLIKGAQGAQQLPLHSSFSSQEPSLNLPGTPLNKELPKQITPKPNTQVTPLQKMLTDFMLNSGAIAANPSPNPLYGRPQNHHPPQQQTGGVDDDSDLPFFPPKRPTTSSTGTHNSIAPSFDIDALNAPLREPTASRKWFNPIIRDPRTGQVLDLPDKSQSTTPPNTGRGGEAWTGGKTSLNGGDGLKSNGLASYLGEGATTGLLGSGPNGMRRSNSLTTLSKDLVLGGGGNQGPYLPGNRRCLADNPLDPDALEGPIRVARCELPQSQMRPVINTPVHPYLSLKDVRSNKHWEDKIICDEVEDLPKSKHVIYRWYLKVERKIIVRIFDCSEGFK